MTPSFSPAAQVAILIVYGLLLSVIRGVLSHQIGIRSRKAKNFGLEFIRGVEITVWNTALFTSFGWDVFTAFACAPAFFVLSWLVRRLQGMLFGMEVSTMAHTLLKIVYFLLTATANIFAWSTDLDLFHFSPETAATMFLYDIGALSCIAGFGACLILIARFKPVVRQVDALQLIMLSHNPMQIMTNLFNLGTLDKLFLAGGTIASKVATYLFIYTVLRRKK